MLSDARTAKAIVIRLKLNQFATSLFFKSVKDAAASQIVAIINRISIVIDW